MCELSRRKSVFSGESNATGSVSIDRLGHGGHMTRPLATAIVSFAILFLVSLTVSGGEFNASVDAGAEMDIADGEVLDLDLQRAYEIALARNLDLQVGRYDLAIADTGIQGASGIFDPSFDLGAESSYNESPAATQLDGAVVTETRNTQYNLGLGGLMPTGGTASIGLGTRRTATNSQFYFLNPSWGTGLTARLNQPLLRNFGTLVTRSRIVVAQTNRDQAAETLKTQVIATLQQVEQAYWDFAAAKVLVDVKLQSLELAQKLLKETKERIRVGTSAPIDLVQSEASVATRNQDLILARNAQANSEDALKQVLGFQTPAEWAMKIIAAEPYVFEPLDVDLASSIETALKERPEIIRQEMSLDITNLNVKLARNAVLPSLDLTGSYGFSGIGGTLSFDDPITGEPSRIKGGFDDSLDQIVDMDYPNWGVGLALKVPLGNNDAKANLARRRFEHHQTETRLSALQQSITHDVRVAVRYLYDGAASVEAAEASKVLAERNVEAEQTKFANGLSTNFLVLQIQDDLANAQLSNLRARLNYRKAIVGYRVATGTLLDELGVDIADAGAPEEDHTLWKDVKWMQFVDFRGDDESEE